mmetsp:Transcript_46710/g.61797  ORF Transcript_46710/g.61797 Transcript_46710/m.61797 type:complete len:91 (+) Transcript_46710:200-472(+)
MANSAVNWQEKLTVKTQTIFDTLVLCDAVVDMSTCVLDLTRKQVGAPPQMFSELIESLVEKVKEQMRLAIVRISETKALLTTNQRTKTVY